MSCEGTEVGEQVINEAAIQTKGWRGVQFGWSYDLVLHLSEAHLLWALTTLLSPRNTCPHQVNTGNVLMFLLSSSLFFYSMQSPTQRVQVTLRSRQGYWFPCIHSGSTFCQPHTNHLLGNPLCRGIH